MAVELENYSFDPDHLRKKYREERDKRLRQDGNEPVSYTHLTLPTNVAV